MKLILILTLIFVSTNLDFVYAQWQPDVRLTNDSYDSYTSYGGSKSIAVSGDTVHVVWHDFRFGGYYEIYYKRSTDGGMSWSDDTRLSDNPHNSQFASVYASGPVVFVVWYDHRDGNDEIYYKRSGDGGVNWGADTRLTNTSDPSAYPAVFISGLYIHVVWSENLNATDEIFYKHSTDGGLSWGTDVQLTNDPGFSIYPSISVSGLNVHVAWVDSRDGNNEIYYKRSSDGGMSWVNDTRLTDDISSSEFPSISSAGQNVYVGWMDNGDAAKWEIYYKRSTDGGNSWESNTRLTYSPENARNPSVSAFGQNVHVVWYDNRDGNNELYYNLSTDYGTNWNTDLRITNNSAGTERPSIYVEDLSVHVVWQDKRDGNWEIYYKQNPTGNPVDVQYINSGIPTDYSLSQNYPNPFNPGTTIQFSIPEQAYVQIEIFNLLGKNISTLIAEEMKAGNYKYYWNAVNYASGIYIYRITANKFVSTRKMILMK